jgi:hypothetical protein
MSSEASKKTSGNSRRPVPLPSTRRASGQSKRTSKRLPMYVIYLSLLYLLWLIFLLIYFSVDDGGSNEGLYTLFLSSFNLFSDIFSSVFYRPRPLFRLEVNEFPKRIMLKWPMPLQL